MLSGSSVCLSTNIIRARLSPAVSQSGMLSSFMHARSFDCRTSYFPLPTGTLPLQILVFIDRTSGTPNRGYPEDRLDASLAILRCSGSGRHAAP